ncbi:hypothetical protein BT93_I1173 [Corymbia citriodora subsp. variegata]|nr:hypothetical protein BT93_I1173 [Corymbia citriodora subsp. variegata]
MQIEDIEFWHENILQAVSQLKHREKDGERQFQVNCRVRKFCPSQKTRTGNEVFKGKSGRHLRAQGCPSGLGCFLPLRDKAV